MSRTAFMARPRARKAITHVTGPTWMVTYNGQLLEPFTPKPNECVKSMLAGMDIDINDAHVEYVGYIHQ
jgi:hypothetical protein